MNIHDETVHVSSGVVSAPIYRRYTKAEDILFALEMNSESVYNLLYKMINRKFAKATVNTSIIEAIVTVVLDAAIKMLQKSCI